MERKDERAQKSAKKQILTSHQSICLRNFHVLWCRCIRGDRSSRPFQLLPLSHFLRQEQLGRLKLQRPVYCSIISCTQKTTLIMQRHV